MSNLGRPFLPPDLRQLIELDRHAPDPPDEVKLSVARRVDRSLELGGVLSAPAPGLGLQVPRSIDSSAPVVPPPITGGFLGWKAVGGAAIAVVIGGAIALSLAMRAPHPSTSPRGADRVALAAMPLAQPGGANALLGVEGDPRAPRGVAAGRGVPAAVTMPGVATPRKAAAARASTGRRAASHASSSIDSLAAERIILDDARAALVRHDAAAALSALRAHDRSFPRGQLLEERESMRVQALALARDFAALHAAGERFQRRFPQSMFLPIVEQALETAP